MSEVMADTGPNFFSGEAGTGKSCLLHHFTQNRCTTLLSQTSLCGAIKLIVSHPVKDHSQHTIGVEFSSRTVKLGEKKVKLQVKGWQTNTLTNELTIVSAMGYSWTGGLRVGPIFRRGRTVLIPS